MASVLLERINEDIKTAMRARDRRRLTALRLITAAVKQREVDERIVLDDAQVLEVLARRAKQRRESIDQYRQAGRQDLVDQEAFELALLEAYLPRQLSDQELEALVSEVIGATGVTSVRDMGKVMGTLKPKLQGRADLGRVSAVVKKKLSG